MFIWCGFSARVCILQDGNWFVQKCLGTCSSFASCEGNWYVYDIGELNSQRLVLIVGTHTYALTHTLPPPSPPAPDVIMPFAGGEGVHEGGPNLYRSCQGRLRQGFEGRGAHRYPVSLDKVREGRALGAALRFSL